MVMWNLVVVVVVCDNSCGSCYSGSIVAVL